MTTFLGLFFGLIRATLVAALVMLACACLGYLVPVLRVVTDALAVVTYAVYCVWGLWCQIHAHYAVRDRRGSPEGT